MSQTPKFRHGRTAALAAAALALVLVLPAGASSVFAADACSVTPLPGYTTLFDGTPESFAKWTHSGPGSYTVQTDCTMKSSGGLGLLYYAAEEFQSYTLHAEWKIEKVADNSGIFVGFPLEGTNTHNNAINKGYEIQIDQIGRSDGAPKHYTGAIYDVQGPNRDTRTNGTDTTGWNTYEITVDAPMITVNLNGVVVNEFKSLSATRDISHGHLGLQAHGTGDVSFFRNIQIKEIAPGSGGGGSGGLPTGSFSQMRNNVGISQGPTSNANFDGGGYAYSSVFLDQAGVRPGGTVTANGLSYIWPNTNAGASDNVIAAGQTVTINAPVGTTTLGLLGAAGNGPSTGGKLTLNYEFTDAAGVTKTIAVDEAISVADWTINGGGGSLPPRNTIAVTTLTRVLQNAAPDGTETYVMSTTVPVDPTMRLVSIKLPRPTTGSMHVFALATK